MVRVGVHVDKAGAEIRALSVQRFIRLFVHEISDRGYFIATYENVARFGKFPCATQNADVFNKKRHIGTLYHVAAPLSYEYMLFLMISSSAMTAGSVIFRKRGMVSPFFVTDSINMPSGRISNIFPAL